MNIEETYEKEDCDEEDADAQERIAYLAGRMDERQAVVAYLQTNGIAHFSGLISLGAHVPQEPSDAEPSQAQ
jgi:hypothetical protein